MRTFWNRESGPTANTAGILLALAALALFGYTLIATAWMSDDAYITWRTVDNFINGDGLRWNVAERVQSFTHPLWLFVNAAVYAVTREGFLTWIAVSMVVSTLAVLTLTLGIARNWGGAVLAILILVFSRGFMDYCSSGLENPLTYLLLALFMAIFFRLQWSVRTLFAMSLVAGLATLNRMDTIVFFLPALLYAWASLRTLRATAALVAGFLPFAAWEVFSILYYGFPFPNTAYAKLGTGIASADLFQQGLYYYEHSWARDPGTLIFLAIGVAMGLLNRQRRYAMLSLGVLLYLVYIAKIGGDFMGGRFFGAPLFVAVAILARSEFPALSPRTWVIAGIVALISLSRPFAPPTTGADFGENVYASKTADAEDDDNIGFKDEHGIGDERRFWYQQSGLLASAPEVAEGLPAPLKNLARGALVFTRGTTTPMPTGRYANEGRKYRENGELGPVVNGSVGFRGFFGGPAVYIMDYYALCDPLLARIPAKYDAKWRIGHFARTRPDGYVLAAEGKLETLKDDGLREYYAHLLSITRGPIFSPDRLKEIAAMNLGRYEHLIPADELRFPAIRKMDYSAVSTEKKAGAKWNAPGTVQLNPSGVQIGLGGEMHNSLIEFSFDNKDSFKILYFRGSEELGSQLVTSPVQEKGGLAIVTVTTPLNAVRDGFDNIRVFPYPDSRKDKLTSMGHMILK